MIKTNQLKEMILRGKLIDRNQADLLISEPIDVLCDAADEIRAHFCSDSFDICTIINGKSGRCSEDCKYCAQSIHNKEKICEYPLLGSDEIVKQAVYNASRGALRYSVVTSGRRLSDIEIDDLCRSIIEVKKKVEIEVCVSAGLLEYEQFEKLKKSGVSRIHCNLETSESFFPSVCTTHTYDEKIAALKAAAKAGLSICSGGIMGLGETISDRIDMAFKLRELGVRSVPVNFLNHIKGTEYENNKPLSDDEKRRIIAVYRFILPYACIRLAGGRGLIADKGRSCFMSGANAAISGDMLTTAGITLEKDIDLVSELGYKVALIDE